MSVACIVQARMGSTRLPGKVLAEICGRPALQFMLDRLHDLPVDHLVVATGDTPDDEPIAELVDRLGIIVVRGPAHDVLGRFRLAVSTVPADVVVRLTADCPLIDPDLVMAIVEPVRDGEADYASNTLIRTYPDGLDAEAFTAAALDEAAREATDPVEREHVTPYIYRRPWRYRLRAVCGDEPLGRERWTVDTAEDLRSVRAIARSVDCSTKASWREMRERHGLQAPADSSDVSARVAFPADRADLRRFAATAVVGGGETEPFDTWSPTDPARRTWVLSVQGRVVGAAGVVVERPLPRLVLGLEDDAAQHAEAALRAVLRALAGDEQVAELVSTVPPEASSWQRALAEAGFRPDDDQPLTRWRWQRRPEQSTDAGRLLVLGTAGLAMAYGVGVSAPPARSTAMSLLHRANQAGVRAVDTAPRYGDAERLVGEARMNAQVLSKWDGRGDPAEVVGGTLRALGRPWLDGLFLHDPDVLASDPDGTIGTAYQLVGREVRALGVSTYTPEQFAACLDDPRITAVQAPISAADQRLVNSGLLKEAAAAGMTVYARSVYLQGALIADPDALPRSLTPLRPHLAMLHGLAERRGGSVRDMCLAFVRDLPGIAGLVVGLQSAEQLDDTLRALAAPGLSDDELDQLGSLPPLPDDVVDPRRWPAPP